MGGGVDLPQFLDTDLGVNLGGGQVAVAQHHLDKADIRAIIQHMGGHGVAEQVAGFRLVDLGVVQVFLDEVGQAVAAPGFVFAVIGQ